MKKILFLAGLILAPVLAQAALSNGGGMGNWKAKQDDNGDVVIKTIITDSTGSTPFATTVPLYEASATFLTSTTQQYNLTATAGLNVPVNVSLKASRGGTSLVFAFSSTNTAPATVATLDGREVVTGASDKTYGPCYAPGTSIFIRASGTASVVGTLVLEQCK